MRRQQILCEDDKLRSQHGRKDATGQNPGNNFRPVRIARCIRSRKAVGLVRGRVQPSTKRTDEEQPKTAVHHRRIGNKPRENPEDRTALQGKAAPEMTREHAQWQRAEPHAEYHRSDRQRCKPLVGREHCPNDAGGGTMTVLLPPASACATASTMALRRASLSSCRIYWIGSATADIRGLRDRRAF